MRCKNNSFIEKIDDCLVRYLAYFNYKNYVCGIGFRGDEKVLEVGCGGGNLSRFLAKKVEKLVCVDCSRYWAGKARRRLRNFSNIKFELADVLNFDKEDYFDIIIVHYVLHDIIQRDKAIGVLKKCLRNDGVVYTREPVRKSHGMLTEEIENLFLQNGFVNEKSWSGYSFPLRGRIYEGVFRKKLL